MNRTYKPYSAFREFVIRTPLLPLNFFFEITSKDDVDDENLKRVFVESPIIQELIFLSSPSLYFELKKWVNGKFMTKKNEEKLKISFLKYLSRSSSRCTPFGLAAGTTVGIMGKETKIDLDSPNSYRRKTVLDTRILAKIYRILTNNKRIRNNSIYYPNSSIYFIGKELRYIKVQYVQGNRSHVLTSVIVTDYLNEILSAAENGIEYYRLIDILKVQNVNKNEAESYIQLIIDAQILINNLEIPLTSNVSVLEFWIEKIQNVEGISEVIFLLKKIQEKLTKLDKKIGNIVDDYFEIKNLLEQFLNEKLNFENIFQTDLYITLRENKIDKSVENQVLSGLSILNKIAPNELNDHLKSFISAFYLRYENQSIPLVEALDTDIGIGYRQNIGKGELNPLIDKIFFLKGNNDLTLNSQIILNEFQQILCRKINESYRLKKRIIQLELSDLPKEQENWENLPDTFYSTFSLIKSGENKKIILKGGGGSSAVNLITRFGKGNKKLFKIIEEVAFKENASKNKGLLSEIVHLPASEFMGNILKRPKFRKWEIPILAASSVAKENQIPISDIEISIIDQKTVVLKSKKLGEEIYPILSSAHNFWTTKSLPIYHFLCDVQSQGKKTSLFIPMGPLQTLFDFIPRIEFKNIILREASWKLTQMDIKELVKNLNNENKLIDAASNLMKLKDMPKIIKLVDGDKGYLVNFSNVLSIKTFIDSVKQKKEIFLQEFLGDKTIVSNVKKGEIYTNEMIFFFQKV